MKKIIYINAGTELQLTQKILKYQFNYSYMKEVTINQQHYIILKPIFSLNSFDHLKLNKSICYTFSYSELNQMKEPYKFLSKTILSLPYKFSQANNYIDNYGNKFILLHN